MLERTEALTSKTPDRDVAVLLAYRSARTEFGLSRIKMGAYLHLIQEHRLWKGTANSWSEYLAAENLQPNAARQYINVAKKFVFELDLSDEVLAKLASAGITAMERAGLIITPDNKDSIIDSLINLSEKDAIQQIIDLSSGHSPSSSDKSNMRVLRLLKEFYGMPPDLQSEFRDKLKK